MKGALETLPGFLYIIIAIGIGLFLFSLLLSYSELFGENQHPTVGDRYTVAKEIAVEIENCWVAHRNGLDGISGTCKEMIINSTELVMEKDVSTFIDCSSIPNNLCLPENCSFCVSKYFNETEQDRIKWLVENNNTKIEISYYGYERSVRVKETI